MEEILTELRAQMEADRQRLREIKLSSRTHTNLKVNRLGIDDDELEGLLADCLAVVSLSGVNMLRRDIDVWHVGYDHNVKRTYFDPENEPDGEFSEAPKRGKGIYIFTLHSGRVLKVGYVSNVASYRFTRGHYRYKKTGSALCNSILAHPERWQELNFNREQVEYNGKISEWLIQRWFEKNTRRVNLFFPSEFSNYTIELVEKFLHCRFNPMFEGRLGLTTI